MTSNDEQSVVFLNNVDLEELYALIVENYNDGFPDIDDDQHINLCVEVNGVCYYDPAIFKTVIYQFLDSKGLLELPRSIHDKNQAQLVLELFVDLDMLKIEENKGDFLVSMVSEKV